MAVVVVLDDTQTDRELLSIVLGYAGHVVLEAEMGDEALALIRQHHPDLVVCDMLMPRMDGYEFVRELRGDPAIATTPVLFYSATYDEGELDHLARACGASVLEKPQDPQVVLAAVEAVLRSDTGASPRPTWRDDAIHTRMVSQKQAAGRAGGAPVAEG